jgi:L-rhamnose mutarotase
LTSTLFAENIINESKCYGERAMEIMRAELSDTDIFRKEELDYGGCCFFSEDKAFRYYFEIKGREATLFSNTTQYILQAIDEFLFYSGFITSIKDENGRTLITRTQKDSYLYKISKIQPSQFYINEKKLESCKKWITKSEDIFVPIVIKDGVSISLDGHTRMRAALDLGYDSVYVYLDEYDDTIFHFVNEAIQRQINNVYDMELVSDEDYELRWNKFCDELFESLR